MLCGRPILYLVLLVCFGTTLNFAQKAGADSKPEDQLRQMERDWLAADAKGDIASLRQLISDDFIGSSFDGGVLRKGDILPQDTGPGGFAGATPGETDARVFGNTGVLIGVLNMGNGPESKPIRVVLVYQKGSQGWMMIAAQLTR